MANESVIIDINIVDENSAERIYKIKQQLTLLKAEQEKLQRTKATSLEQDKEISKQLDLNRAEYSALQAELKAYEKEIANEIKANIQAEGSLKQMRLQLSNLTQQYDSLSKAERQSASGKELEEKIKNLTAEIYESEKATGRFQRNVGNYPDVFNLADSSIGKLASTMQTFAGTTQRGGNVFINMLKNIGGSIVQFGRMLLTTPIGWFAAAIALVVAAISMLSEGFKKNDAAMTSLKKSFASFEPIIDVVKSLFVGLADVIARVVSTIVSAITAVTNFFGITSKKASENTENIVESIDKLEEVERQYTVNSAKRTRDALQLREEARNKEKYTAKDREELLQRAINLEKQNLEDQKKIAAEHLRILEAKASKEKDTSDETADKIAQARAKMYQAEIEYYQGTRRLNSEIKTAIAEQRKEEEEKQKQLLELAKKRRDTEQELVRKYEDEVRQIIADAKAKAIEDEKARAKREIEDLEKKLKEEENLTKTAKIAIAKTIEQIKINSEIKISEIEKAASEERFNKELERELTNISNKIAVAKKGSEEELKLKLEQIELLRKQEIANAEKTGVDVSLINKKFDNEVNTAKQEILKARLENERQILQNEFNRKKNQLFGQEQELAELELEQARQQADALIALNEEQKAAMFETNAKYDEAVIASKERVANAERNVAAIALKNFETQVKTLQGFGGVISDVFSEIAGDSKELLIFQKMIALANAGLTLAEAIAAATSAATKGDPYTIALRIASAVGGVIIAFSQVFKAINSVNIPEKPKFAKGGIVGGNSFTGDNVIVRVNSGEMILNKQQQAALLDIATKGTTSQQLFDYELLSNLIITGVSSLPAPVLDYKEYTNFKNNVIKLNEYANI